MKYILILLIVISFSSSAFASENDIILPEVPTVAGMDIIQAMESRAGVRSFDENAVSLEAISTILWAGYGIIYKDGDKTVHGYDAITGATPKNRRSIPVAWGKSYLKLYLLLKDGAYEYLPDNHKLKLINIENLIQKSGSTAKEAYGAIVVAVDYDKMPGRRKAKNVAFMSAGSSAQNMIVAGAAFNIQMLIQVSIKHKKIRKGLNLPKSVEPLSVLSFGYPK